MSEQLIATPGVFGENGNFLLERELGSGGMGGVYMGRDKMLDRPVAVKVMLKELGSDAEFVEKFKKEAQSAARLIHPNIAQIYSYGICDGMPYMAMELACGGSLYSIMTSSPGKADVARVIKICQQVAQALQCASDQGCVHGDVKPENILLDANGNAKLVDFGLVAMQKETDEIWGTPYYISPEKVKKEPIDFRADMYSLGGTLYHALTGVAPFEGEDSIAVVKKRFEGMPKKPSEIRPELTDAIDSLVMKMLALKKEDRYPSFEALLEAFKDVLTNGLTRSGGTEAKSAAAPAAAKPTTSSKRMLVRGRRTMMMKHSTAVKSGAAAKKADGAAEAAEGEEPTNLNGDEPAPENPEKTDAEGEDDEEGGNLGVKIAIVIGAIVLVIAATVGGLIWYKVADKKARAAEQQQQIVDGFAKANGAIKDTVENAKKFADEFDAFAAKAVEECEKPTVELRKILPAEIAALLKPEPTKELIDAIAATNEVPPAAVAPAPDPAAAPAASAATNAAPTAAAATTNAPAAAAKAPPAKPAADAKKDAAKKPDVKKGDDKKGDAKKPEAKKGDAKKGAAKDAKPEPPKPEGKPPAPTSPAITAMNELWGRAYGCQACAVRIRHAVRQIVKKSGEAANYNEATLENVEKLAELSRTLVDMLEQVKSSKDVETVKKGITFIKSKGAKTVESTVKQLRIEKLENDRKAKAEAAAAAEKERLEKKEAERKAKVDKETEAVKSKYELLAAQGFSLLNNWKNVIGQIETMKSEFETPEGQLQADLEIRKLTNMKKVHELLIKHMPGTKNEKPYTFRKGKLKGFTVVRTSASDLELTRKDDKKGTKKYKATWQKFFKDNYHNVLELFNQYVFNGRKNAGLGKLDVADALAGSAMMIKVFYSSEDTASERSEQLAKKSIEEFPHYYKTVVSLFPDIDFGAAPTIEEE